MNELDRMDEIVGESGEPGKGCLSSIVAVGMAVVAGLILATGPAHALTPRKPTGCLVTVPNTYGLDELAATSALALKGLSAYVWMNKEAGQWTVVYSEPEPGALVDRCVNPLVEIWIGQ
jgi:hypothetical protein